jgi:DNA replication licensing factor MCM2
MPAFMQSDDDEEAFGEGPLAGINVGRRRRQYDERMAEDDLAGEEVRTTAVTRVAEG